MILYRFETAEHSAQTKILFHAEEKNYRSCYPASDLLFLMMVFEAGATVPSLCNLFLLHNVLNISKSGMNHMGMQTWPKPPEISDVGVREISCCNYDGGCRG